MEEKKKRIITPKFLTSFCNLLIPNKIMKGKPIPPENQKYGCTAIFDPAKLSPEDQKRWVSMKELADEVCFARFGKKVDAMGRTFKNPFRESSEKEGMAGFTPGTIFISMTSKIQPEVVDSDGKTLITNIKDVYSGCYGRASVGCYSFDNEGKGVAFGLNSFKKVANGKPLVERISAEKAFADVGEEDMSDEEEDLT